VWVSSTPPLTWVKAGPGYSAHADTAGLELLAYCSAASWSPSLVAISVLKVTMHVCQPVAKELLVKMVSISILSPLPGMVISWLDEDTSGNVWAVAWVDCNRLGAHRPLHTSLAG
jgi:hypothetical protein